MVDSEPNTPQHTLRPKPQQHTLSIDIKDQEIEHTVNTPQWIISIMDKLELDQACQDDVASTWSKRCIYKVPHYLRECDDRSYVPQIVSIGPYHHGEERLRNMDGHKRRSVKQILKRTGTDALKKYLDALKKSEKTIRACYEGPIGFESDEFLEMMLLDGCFILELFRGAEEEEGFEKLGYLKNDPIFAKRDSMGMIQRDLILLENQLPLFVLDLLLEIQQPELKGHVSKLALYFFDTLNLTHQPDPLSDQCSFHCLEVFRRGLLRPRPSSLGDAPTFDPLSDQGSLHCLDVFRRELLRPRPALTKSSTGRLQSSLGDASTLDTSSDQGILHCLKSVFRRVLQLMKRSDSNGDSKQHLQLIHCATELRDAGIKFKRHKTDRFWDVKFKNGILQIPTLLIQDGTKSLFLNLIAFERCHLDCTRDITSYVVFMNNLINSPEDVGYLYKCGIIDHGLGSDAEVADLFNRLCKEVVFDKSESYLSTLSDQVNRYFNQRWHSWRASLKQNYFSNPWAIISLIAAVILLLLTFAQTFYTVYAYYRPR